jgi:spermidine/putrescine transport system permease protein
MTSSLDKITWYGFAGVTVAFMLSPLVILILFCFSEGALLSFPITGLSFRWFETLFAREQFWGALENSLIVTGSVGFVSTVVGTMTAMGLARMRANISFLVMSVLTVPIMVPPLMLGIVFLSYYTTWLEIRLSLHTVIMAHIVFTQPFVILIVNARMAGFDFAALDSAQDLGASRIYAFFTITLPIIRSSILGAALIAMALSLDDFLVTFFTIGGGNTLPIFMWGMLRKGVDPSINIVAVILMLLSIGVSLIGLRVTRYRG